MSRMHLDSELFPFLGVLLITIIVIITYNGKVSHHGIESPNIDINRNTSTSVDKSISHSNTGGPQLKDNDSIEEKKNAYFEGINLSALSFLHSTSTEDHETLKEVARNLEIVTVRYR